MATALNSEDEGDPERALEHYRKALDIDPDRPECLSEFGLLAVRQGDAEEGLAALRRAAELAPGAPEVLARLVDGLDLLGQSEEACRYLRAAQFRNARDVRFRRLWDDYRFRQLHARQQADRRERLARQTDDGSPAILPFVRPDPGIAPDGARRVRRDAAATGRRPHFGWSAEMPDQKHA